MKKQSKRIKRRDNITSLAFYFGLSGRRCVLVAVMLHSNFVTTELLGAAGSIAANTEGNNALFPFSVIQNNGGEKWGYINRRGSVIIPPTFDDAGTFSEGLALVYEEKGGRKFINSSGRVVIDLPGDVVGAGSFCEGACLANRGGKPTIHGILGGKWGYLDRSGHFIFEPRFISGGDVPVSAFSDGLAACRDDKLWGFINKRGEWVIQPAYSGAKQYAGGMAAVAVREKWGYINRKGDTIIDFEYDFLGSFSQGLCAATRGKSKGFIDHTGKWIIKIDQQAVLDDRSVFCNGLAAVLAPQGKPVPPSLICPKCGQSLNGMKFGERCKVCGAELTGDLKWGFVDVNGRFVILPQFEDVFPFSEGRAAVALDKEGKSRWGFIDPTGKPVIPMTFTHVYGNGFSGGLARVSAEDGETEVSVYINETGTLVKKDGRSVANQE